MPLFIPRKHYRWQHILLCDGEPNGEFLKCLYQSSLNLPQEKKVGTSSYYYRALVRYGFFSFFFLFIYSKEQHQMTQREEHLSCIRPGLRLAELLRLTLADTNRSSVYVWEDCADYYVTIPVAHYRNIPIVEFNTLLNTSIECSGGQVLQIDNVLVLLAIYSPIRDLNESHRASLVTSTSNNRLDPSVATCIFPRIDTYQVEEHKLKIKREFFQQGQTLRLSYPVAPNIIKLAIISHLLHNGIIRYIHNHQTINITAPSHIVQLVHNNSGLYFDMIEKAYNYLMLTVEQNFIPLTPASMHSAEEYARLALQSR